jgi:hypothetical protein
MLLTGADRERALKEFHALAEAEAKHRRENRLDQYRPYPKQREFHDAGLQHRERLFRSDNQLGKTWCAGAEVAFHLTGCYPD